MQAMLRRTRDDRSADDRGFTLIEMLVVVVIIGILAAISIPLYLNYKKGAENKSAESDVRGAIAAVEQYYTENDTTYPPSKDGVKSTKLEFEGPNSTQTATVSTNNTLSYALSQDGTYYNICGQNASGGTIYAYNSRSGQPVHTYNGTFATCLTSTN